MAKRQYKPKYPLTLKVGQMAVVTPRKGKPYQLGVGDVITQEFLNDDDITMVRMVQIDKWGAVQAILLKVNLIPLDDIIKIQKEKGYTGEIAILAMRLLDYVNMGNYYEIYPSGQNDDEAFSAFDDDGKCIKAGREYSEEDRLKAVELAVLVHPEFWNQTHANLYENYRNEDLLHDAGNLAQSELRERLDPGHKEFAAAMEAEWSDFEKQFEQEKKDRH